MRKKIKQVLCMFSALVVMICCAVPAFADDTVTKNDLSSVKWNIVSKSSDIPHFTDVYNNFSSTISKTDNYIAVYGKKSDGTSETNILYFDPTAIAYYSFTNNQFLFGSNFDYDSQRLLFKFDSSDKYTESVGYGGWDVTKPSGFPKSKCKALLNLNDYVQSTVKVYFHTKIYDFDNIENELEPPDPNAVPAPFTVTYSPDLKLNLKRKTSDYETKSIDVTLTLNQDYLDWYIRRYAEMKLNVEVGKLDSESIEAILGTKNLAEVFDLTGCGKSKCIYFISLSDPSKPLRTVTQNSVYTYLSQQRYSIVDKDNGDIDGSTSTAVYANGLYPYFTVDFKEYFKHTMQSDIASENCSYKKYQAVIKNLPTYQLSIPLENIDAEKFEVISVLNSILTCETLFPTESGQSVFNGSFKSAYSVDRGPNGVNFNNIDYINVDKWDTDDTGYLDYFSKSDCYSVYTAQFSFDSYPKYVPLKDGKGNDIDMIKTNPFDFSKSPVAPGTYQSVNKDGTLSEERTLEEQKKHDKDNTFSKNFASVDYTDFSSIFSTSSSYFEFLTASIRILPDWFIATFTAWFVTFLTLALIKYVIQ